MKHTGKRRSGGGAVLLVLLFVPLIAVGAGCGGGGGGGGTAGATGFLKGTVSVVDLALNPASAAGYQVYVQGAWNGVATVASSGQYQVAGIPPGTYTVLLVPPSPPAGVAYAIRPGDGQMRGVKVFAGLGSDLNFAVDHIPAPAF